ncbi:MAG: DUF6788 family protein [Terriglobales bacterium]
MPDTLASLEAQRGELLDELVGLGDFRSGSITAIRGRCGKATCHCHRPGHPGHGPNYRLTRKVQGRTISETFATPAELRKAQREVQSYHRFRQLSQKLLEVNERICQARPAAKEDLTPQEKKRPRRSTNRFIKK